MKIKNKDYNPIYYKSQDEMDKPLNELMEQLRGDISNVRGKLFDIKHLYGYDDRIEHIEGGLTCMLCAMYNTIEEWKKLEEKHNKQNEAQTVTTKIVS